ncbi:hypothetical protein COV17_04045 [Candidatus Woesearchaeota archaeon CG10_big_fil_rev_8_21_14_0_10_36_11]|nr:MAG: hypothetical protein COV17_04045 [Candidatus Woesearchaeota archaeon CG10_big_fil_rev_8_21_14_0_10_36_11]
MPLRDPKKKESEMISLFPEFSPMRVKYKDIFDLKAFYESLREWLLENDWMDAQGDIDHWETYYGERVTQNSMREIWINWRVKKTPKDIAKWEGGKTALLYYMDFDWHCVAVTDTEVIKEGHKLKVNKGEVELVMKAFVDPIYKQEFAKNSILKQFQSIFTKRVYRKVLEQRKKELYQETYTMQNFIKQWFKLKRYLPYEEKQGFFRSYAWPSHKKEE